MGYSGAIDNTIQCPLKWNREMVRAEVMLMDQGKAVLELILNIRYLQVVKSTPVIT